MSRNWQATLFAVLAMALSALGLQIANHAVPIPDVWQWAVPILLVIISIASPTFKQAAVTGAVNLHAFVFALLIAVITVFAQLLAAGQVPGTSAWVWLAPVLVAIITAVSPPPTTTT